MLLATLIQDIQQSLTFAGSLPQILSDTLLENLITKEAKPYFHQNYHPCCIKKHLLLRKAKNIILPNTVFRVVKISSITKDVGFFDGSLKFSFHTQSKVLNILGDWEEMAVAEVYVTLPDEDLFNLSLFQEYVQVKAKIALGSYLSTIEYKVHGVKIDGSVILDVAIKDLTRILAEIKS